MFNNLWAFFLCAALVFITQFTLLKPILEYGLFNTTQDWPNLIWYHILDLSFWDKLVYIWKNYGLHESAQVFHIGILSNFLGFNYSAYQFVNVTLKAIGTISFFPLVLVLFKSRKLAFLATTLYGISSATAGSFLWVVKGGEYIGIMILNIFLITYYFVILKNSKVLLLISSFLFLTAYLMAPPRMFPQLLLIPLVEIYCLLKTKKIKNLKISLARVLVYILPVVLISISAPISPGFPFAKQPFILLNTIAVGNWHNLLDPFAGIGWTLVTNDYWKFFGTLEYEILTNFNNYLIFLFQGPVLIFGILTVLMSIILSNKPWKFFLLVFSLNFVLEIFMFILTSHHFNLIFNVVKSYPGHFVQTKYPTLLGIYIYTLAFVAFWEWKRGMKNALYEALWIGPVFSAIFLWPAWIIMGPLINDWSSVHWYFGIPAMGTTLLLAAILVLFYEKLKSGNLPRIFAIVAISLIIITFYHSHSAAIAKQYLGINPEKISLVDQQNLHNKLIRKLGDSAKFGDVLVYLDIVKDDLNLRRTQQFYKEALVVNDFGDWVHLGRSIYNTIINGCIEAILDRNELKSALQMDNSKARFKYSGLCIDGDRSTRSRNKKDVVSYELEDFYAFRLHNGEFIDIKEEILKDLGIYSR